jgi:acyl-CoA reductase-like NAD-dependent aldehyde dehydrogenase
VPLVLALRAVAPSLALGDTVVLKPASLAPIAGGQLLVEATSFAASRSRSAYAAAWCA